MKVYVIFGQRKESYPGQFGLEALVCMSEHENEENSSYLPDTLQEKRDSDEFSSVAIVTLEVNATSIRKILQPELTAISAAVCSPVDGDSVG